MEDVERSIENATGLGAEVMMPAMDVMSAGRMAVLGDPEGAMFALWQAKDHCGAQIANVPNTWSWNELVSRDLPQACKFYSDMFGWEISKDEASEIEYWNICNQGRLNGGMTAMQPGTPDAIPAYWSVYFSVADIKQSVEQLQQLGGKLLHGPFTVEPGHIAIVSEPGDGVFSLIEMTTPPDEFP